jgi:Flp pilus assembly protein TadD
MLLARDRCDEGVVPLERVTELAPRAATPWVLLGSCRGQFENVVAAEQAFATALSLHPFHPVALKRMALLYARHGRILEARALFTRFVRAGYTDAEVTGWLARIASMTEVNPKAGEGPPGGR